MKLYEYSCPGNVQLAKLDKPAFLSFFFFKWLDIIALLKDILVS